ncbi:MAG: Crp/Fnr family transcriptional regulator [Granulosicoccus sp.]|nr:Crp/Fnr family transcriptional regulator [Granulosicoccus sp.]
MTEQSIGDYLSNHEFFAGLNADFMAFLTSTASEIQAEQGDVLFQQGTNAQQFYVLRHGEIAVQVPAMLGPALRIQTLRENQLLGWSWLIPPYRWNFQALALEDSVLLKFDGSLILAHCEEDPKFGYELIKRFAGLMSERLDAARQKMMDQWDPPGFA